MARVYAQQPARYGQPQGGASFRVAPPPMSTAVRMPTPTVMMASQPLPMNTVRTPSVTPSVPMGGNAAIPPEINAPESLTASLPDPASVQAQKETYVNALDEQLQTGAAAIDKRLQDQREDFRGRAEERKAAYGIQVDQQVRMKEMQVDQVYAQQVKDLKNQVARVRAQIEQQAMQMAYEYQGKKAEEDMLGQIFQLQQEQKALEMMHIPVLPQLGPLPSVPSVPSLPCAPSFRTSSYQPPPVSVSRPASYAPPARSASFAPPIATTPTTTPRPMVLQGGAQRPSFAVPTSVARSPSYAQLGQTTSRPGSLRVPTGSIRR